MAAGQMWLDGAHEQFEALNASLIDRTRTMLTDIIAQPAEHARLLNTLALLEHTGSYRIMASQHGERATQPTLRHLAEEAQHAFFMKRQAEKTAGRALEFVDCDLLAGSTARSYFRRLEALIHGKLRREESGHATYLYMSMVIEFRALWFYELYQETLKSAGNAISLKRIIGEEASHLTDMTQRLEEMGELSGNRVDTFIANEQRLYMRLLRALTPAH
jgi:rubrerythrin